MSKIGKDIVNGDSTNTTSEPIKLCRFVSLLPPSGQLTQTAAYAKDPKAYLKSKLGSPTFKQRQHLLSIPEAEIDKDIYGTGTHKTRFQSHIAKLFDKEEALFFITGVQAQLAALKIHAQRLQRRAVAWHVTSHLESAEERAFAELYGLDRILIGGNEDQNPSVDEIKAVLSLPENERPAVVLLELPNRSLGCQTYSFSELEQISAACKEANVKFHLDGARIWEIEPFYRHTAGKSFADIAALFESVYVSFYKGLRSTSAGAMLLGDAELIKEAKVWQRRAGGNAYTLFFEVVECERAFNDNIGTFAEKWEKMSTIQDAVLAATEKCKITNGERIVDFFTKPATCCQTRTIFRGFTTDELLAARDAVERKLNIRVFDRVRPKQTLDEMSKKEREKMAEAGGNNVEVKKDRDGEERVHEIEWFIGTETLGLDDKVFVDGYVGLCKELLAASKD